MSQGHHFQSLINHWQACGRVQAPSQQQAQNTASPVQRPNMLALGLLGQTAQPLPKLCIEPSCMQQGRFDLSYNRKADASHSVQAQLHKNHCHVCAEPLSLLSRVDIRIRSS